jgi:multiple sugar transport system permease protein
MAALSLDETSGKNEKPRRSRLEKRNTLLGMLFISPWIIGFLAFTLYPMVMSLFYSFTEYHARRASEWVGLQNYISMFHDDLYWTSLGNTLYMVVISVPVLLFFSFICAVLLNLKIKGQSFYRVIYFLPSIVPTVASTLLWLWMLNPQTGIVNSALDLFGINGPNWFQDPYWSKPALILLGLWGVGGTIIIYLSGLQDVPTALLEAAELDGANWFQRLRHITLPMVSPITLFNLITGVIAMFQYFSQAYVFGAAASTSENALGAPLSSTLFYSVYLYQRGISYLDIGVASAMAWVLFFIILGCTYLLLKVSDKFTYYAG